MVESRRIRDREVSEGTSHGLTTQKPTTKAGKRAFKEITVYAGQITFRAPLETEPRPQEVCGQTEEHPLKEDQYFPVSLRPTLTPLTVMSISYTGTGCLLTYVFKPYRLNRSLQLFNVYA